jgi:hypothetical protein
MNMNVMQYFPLIASGYKKNKGFLAIYGVYCVLIFYDKEHKSLKILHDDIYTLLLLDGDKIIYILFVLYDYGYR